MVQYVLTPWRDRHELLLVRHQFYGSSGPTVGGDGGDGGGGGGSWLSGAEGNSQDDQLRRTSSSRSMRLHQAVARVSMWMQRGNCPHMVESTALLTAAVLSDEEAVGSEGGDGRAASAAYAARAAYSAAFSRFVTGLLDGHQERQRKQSMYALAKMIGLPATFVELRHQATHEQLPPLGKLRSAARKAMRWIWEYYWRHLGPEGEGQGGACEAAVLRYLVVAEEQDDGGEDGLRELRRAWDREELLRCLAGLQGRLPGNQAQLKCLRLSKELVKKEKQPGERGEAEEGTLRTAGGPPEAAVEAEAEADSASDTGWSLYQGPWRPKPIGIV